MSQDNKVTSLWNQQITSQPDHATGLTSYFDIEKEHVLPDKSVVKKEGEKQ
jgi:hypothetical protein